MTIPAPAHTPGPWVALDIGEVVTENLEVCIATINGSDTSTVEEDEANARLIAAAPALVAALDRLLNEACPNRQYVNGHPAAEDARAALALALGEQ